MTWLILSAAGSATIVWAVCRAAGRRTEGW